jgi:hypothetical protein
MYLGSSLEFATCVHPQNVCIVGDGSLFQEVIEQLVTKRTNSLVSSTIFPAITVCRVNPCASRSFFLAAAVSFFNFSRSAYKG